MTFQDVGALGELLAAVATLATLVYLASQIRMAKRAFDRQRSQDLQTMFNTNNQVIAANPELADAIAKLQIGEDISASQSVQVLGWFVAQINGYENLYLQTADIDPKDMKLDLRQLITTQFTPAWTRQIWLENQDYFSSEFRAFVNECIEEFQEPRRDQVDGNAGT